MKSLTLLALATLLTTEAAIAQSVQILPASPPAPVQGNSNNAFPWNRINGPIRLQHQWDQSNFASILSPILISGISFRMKDTTPGSCTGGTYQNVIIDVSTSANDSLNLDSQYDNNHGPDRTNVLTGTVDVLPSTHNGVGVGPDYIEIVFSSPFRFDPRTATNGLLIDIRHDGTWGGIGGTSYQNAHYSGTAVNAAGSRVFNTFDMNATTGTVTNSYSAAAKIKYVPANGIWPDFDATPRKGGPNLSVQFTDQSFTNDPNGIVSWEWDFGDGTTSTAQNPTHVFTCGSFDITLKVADTINGSKSVKKTNHIEAGLVTADFSASGTFGAAPYSVTFTDASTGGPVSWAWDFGDGGTSTAQNPTHTYTTGGKFNVTLVATGMCDRDTMTKSGHIEVCASAGNSRSLATLTAGSNGLSSPRAGNLFDLSVINKSGIQITSIDVNDQATTGTVTIAVYLTPTTYVGKHLLRSQWTLVSTGTGQNTGGASTTLTPIDVDDFYLAPGDYGVYIQQVIGGVHYSNGNATNSVHQNCDVRFTGGISMNVPWTGSPFSPRIWNGVLHYSANDAAANGPFGYGCRGSNSIVPQFSMDAEPALGGTGNILISYLTPVPSGAAFLFLGVQKQMFDLGPMGAPGCFLQTNVVNTLGVTNINGTATQPFGIPNIASFVGIQLTMQGAGADAAANALGVSATAGHSLRIGN